MKWISQFSLENQVAVVTGAAGGLGQELVKILLDAGANVVLADLNENKLKTFSNTLDPGSQNTMPVLCNITKKKDISDLIKRTEDRFSSIDILVNCAGILGNDCPMDEVTEAQWDEVMEINLKGTWLVSTEIAKFMIERAIQGRIINISSSLGLRAQLKRIAYAPSKAGVEHLTRNMAMELVLSKIRVNCLAPGWMNTPMVKELLEGPEGKRWQQAIPMRRAAEPEELAGPLLLLASKASSYMTGTILRVDGGYAYCGIELPD